MSNTVLFGPAGHCEKFFESGNRSALNAPEWVRKSGLDCYEYQGGHGIKISDDAALELGKRACDNSVLLSIHAPYYISLSSTEKEKRDRSVIYIMQALHAAKLMGADRIVVHSGSCGKITRKEALNFALDTLDKALNQAVKEGYDDIYICPETMGKVNQLGNIDEVIALCKLSDKLIPTLDFGHINAQTKGTLKTTESFEEIFEKLDKKLNSYQATNFHSHYSRIEYTNAGEKKHRTFAEREFEPDFEPLAEALIKYKLTPRIICESAGTQTEDAVEIKGIFNRMGGV